MSHQDFQSLKESLIMPRAKHDKIASDVIAAPWPTASDELCVYMIHGTDVFSGTLDQAKKSLEYVQAITRVEKDRAPWHPKPEDYQIYQLVPINSAE